MAWLIDTLFTLQKNLPASIDLNKPGSFSLPDLLAYLHSTNNISLHFLLSSPTRGFLTAICRRLTHLDFIARKAIQISPTTTSTTNTPNPQNPNQQSPTPQPTSTLSPALREAYMQIATLTSSTIVRIKTMETLLLSLTSLVRVAYSNALPPPQASNSSASIRNAQEIKMLFGGPFPEAFKTVIVELFREGGLLSGVRDEIDPARLFFADFTMLEVDEDDDYGLRQRKKSGRTMDSFRKVWLQKPGKKGVADGQANGVVNVHRNVSVGAGGGGRWRRCNRCAAVMEDVLSQRHALQWLVMQQRRCFCSGYWTTLAPGDTVP